MGRGGAMLKSRIAIIGGGNMGGAVLHALMELRMEPKDLYLIEISDRVREEYVDRYGISGSSSIDEELSCYDVIVLAVKPQNMSDVLAQLNNFVTNKNLVLSVAAGIKLAFIEGRLGDGQPVARTMPNIAAKVGSAAVALCYNRHLTDSQCTLARSIASSIGMAVEVDEEKMDAVTGLSGSGPAFVFLMIEALADGGVLLGLDRRTALALAVQTVFGAASMLRDSELHPAVLRESVTSPGGTTAAGLFELERGGFRHLVTSAVEAAAEKSAILGEKYSH
jgi:pyrroline-5-carboxylate reductase